MKTRNVMVVAFSFFCANACAQINFQTTTISKLPGWNKDQQNRALKTLQTSCRKILSQPLGREIGSQRIKMTVRDWQPMCIAALKIKSHKLSLAREFFSTWFTAYSVSNNNNFAGKFTGYYLPTLHGSLTKTPSYYSPIYARPNNLISVKLGKFNAALAGKTIVGKVIQQQLLPYNLTRQQINHGALKGRAKIIAWTDPIDRYFLQIQGSGALKLPNNKVLLLGFNGKNGSAYVSIGRILIDDGIMSRQQVSMQSIKKWLFNHPNKVQNLFNQNPSFVFFKSLNQQSPMGTQNVPLTAGRSLAVDHRLIPLGTPVWLSTNIPTMKNKNTPFKHLMIAQDTGGAIRGAVRGDVYWGSGKRAEYIAGHMNSAGRYWILLPKTLKI